MRQPWRYTTALGLMALLALSVSAPRARAASDGAGWLGVTMQSMTAGLRDGIGYDGDGVLVNRVEPDSPADRAGVRKGDVLTSFNSRALTSESMLADLVSQASPGQRISLGLWRDGQRQTLSVRLGARPDGDDGTPAPDRYRSRTSTRYHDDSDNGDDDDNGYAPTPPTPPTPPTAPMAPMTPMPRMYWNGGDFQGMQGMKELRGAMKMLGRGRLGVQVQDLNDDDDAPGGRGVRVEDVTDDTPASRAGFRSGDIIVRVGDRSIADSRELRQSLADRPAGRVEVQVLRRGERVTLTPVLDDRDQLIGKGWKQTSPGEWRFDGPNGDKHIILNRSGGDDDEDMAPRVKVKRWSSDDDGDDDGGMGMGSGHSHRIVVRDGSGDDMPLIRARDARDRAEMERQIAELKRQIQELKRQLEEERR